MAKNPNAPGGSNRQGPKVKSGGKRGPIVGKMTSVAGTQKPFTLKEGTSRPGSMSGHNWKRKPPH